MARYRVSFDLTMTASPLAVRTEVLSWLRTAPWKWVQQVTNTLKVEKIG